MGRWYRGVPKNMTVETASNRVLKDVARYVVAHKKPERRPDQPHWDLQARLAQNPCDQTALKQWGEHMQRKRYTQVMKKLRHFRKSAIGSTRTFFADLATCLVRPAHVSSMSPTVASATKRLPDFAEDPHWDSEKAFKVLPSLRVPDTPVSQTLPTWREFQEAAIQPKKKAMGMDAVPPHTMQWLPKNVQWILYRRVCEVWHRGHMQIEWTDSRISLLYKKGDPRGASIYRPIAVSTCIYQITTKLILRRIKTPLTEVLSEHQAGRRRGHTTLSQAIKLWSSALSMPGTPDVVLLDIAKAHPSTPHPLLWAAMQQVGVPHRYISMMQYASQETRCYYRVDGEKHSYHQRRGLKEGCPLSPLLFCVVYEMFHRTPSTSTRTWMMWPLSRRTDQLRWPYSGGSRTWETRWASTCTGGKQRCTVGRQPAGLARCCGTGRLILFDPPILSYLGHIIAHPQWAQKARLVYLDLITSDLAQYAHIAMDGWEQKQVVNSILMPRWLHLAVLIPSDSWYKEVDDLCSVFVHQPKGMVLGRNTK